MALRTVEHIFTGEVAPYATYDSTKTSMGELIQQRTGNTLLEKFAGPMPLGLARPMEASTAIAVAYPHVIPFSENIHWVFAIENSTAAATRRIVVYEFNRLTSVFTWKGFVTLTFPTTTSHTVRGFRMSRELYTTGTVSVSGTAVTGSGTDWTDSRLAVGSRIGFGSTVPSEITTWYQISAIGSNTGITLAADAGTISSGPYVIEDLRAIVSTTNATTTNGGLFIVKGLSYDIFSIGGTTIPAATTVDNIRAVYWLADAATVSNITAGGSAVQSKVSWSDQSVYVLDGTASIKVYKYNIRASLTSLTAGKTTAAFILSTGAQTTTGTTSQANNGRIGVLYHGPGNGFECLYFATTTRIYRVDLSGITSGNTLWHSDAMVEMPPGGITTYAVTGVMSSVEIADKIDRLIVISTGAAGARSYVTKYNTISDPFDHIFLVDSKQLDQASAESDSVVHPTINATVMSVWSEDGICYLCRNGTTAALNQIYALPLAAHWTYASVSGNPQRLITPELQTDNVSQFKRIYVNSIKQIGSTTLGLPPEPFRVYYRTSGISDDSGLWESLDDTGTLEGIGSASSIQVMIEFKTIGSFCVPARVFSVAVVYEDTTTDSHYQPSVSQSSVTGKIFAWRFSSSFGGTVPTLRIRLYNAVTGGILLDDITTSSTSGTWEKSTDGGSSWSAYNTTDKANETTYIRYTPSSLADNIKVRALLTQN